MPGQKQHRIFIAINLPKEVKKALGRHEERLQDLPAKWTKQENLHVALLFIGNVTDVELGDICLITREIAAKHSAIDISLNKIGYGPNDKLPPKMVWAKGEKSKELAALKNDLENALLEKVQFVPDNKGFTPHVTLARISAFAWRQINPEERPEVNANTNLVFTAESIEVMESEMKKGGPEYTVIESCSLGEELKK